MKEDLLQYIWKFQLFNKGNLATTDGHSLMILNPGLHNKNQGPDFLEAKIKLGEEEWVGHIEIHLRSSDWDAHRHYDDINYQNVILHVVLNHDKEILDYRGHRILALELHNRISGILLEKYQRLLDYPTFIACENQLPPMSDITLINWAERLVAERLMQKSISILSMLSENGGHWEETFWWLIASNFGMKINGEAFQQMARSISVNLLAKHRNNPKAIEAMLFGQVGLLDGNFKENYPLELAKEYHFYQKKYQLKPINIRLKFSQMRPSNFPTIRLAQLSQFICSSHHLFSKIRLCKSAEELRSFFQFGTSEYWHTHYQLDTLSDFRKKHVGKSMVNNMLINTIAPILFAYGQFHQEDEYKERAIDLLGQIEAESNHITRKFELLGFRNETALDSQFLLQLKNHYCDERLCLNCAIGNKIIRN